MKYGFFVAIALGLIALAPAQAQQQVRITVENVQPDDGFYATPLWVGFHDGNFDYFDEGASASGAVEALAEGGMLDLLIAQFEAESSGKNGVLANPAGFGGGPVLDPGEMSSMIFDLDAGDRFLSFGSMVIPSNDGFFGNDSGTAFEVLDAAGNFNFSGPIELTLAQLWDGGTELNNGLGAAFSATGGTATDTTDPIALHGGLDNFDGTNTADGTTINFANASASPVLRISISAVPEPGSMIALVALGGIVIARRRRIA